MQLFRSNLLGHRQVICNTCIPMSVELVLKLINLMPHDDFSFQNDNSKIGHSDWIHKGFKYPFNEPQVKFKREFKLTDYPQYKDKGDRGEHFLKDNHFEKLFETIDNELSEGRYVIISLNSGENCYHMEVIYNKINDDKYETVTFYCSNLEPKFWKQDLRKRVREMKGTDILTYKWI